MDLVDNGDGRMSIRGTEDHMLKYIFWEEVEILYFLLETQKPTDRYLGLAYSLSQPLQREMMRNMREKR